MSGIRRCQLVVSAQRPGEQAFQFVFRVTTKSKEQACSRIFTEFIKEIAIVGEILVFIRTTTLLIGEKNRIKTVFTKHFAAGSGLVIIETQTVVEANSLSGYIYINRRRIIIIRRCI